MATPTVISICSGVGMLDLGLRLACGARTVCYLEREAPSVEVLVSRFADGTLDECPIWSDVSTFDARPWRGLVDIVAGGIPCQPFSVAGKREGNADERAIAPTVLRIIEGCLPSVVFIENVPPWVLRGFAAPFLDRLHDLGYDIAPPFFCRASDVGAPHRRERVFVMAYRDGDGLERVRQSGIRELEDACRDDVERRGFDLADTTNKRHERDGDAWGRRRGPSDDGLDLGHAESQRRRKGRSESARFIWELSSCESDIAVGDAKHPKRWPDADARRDNRQGENRQGKAASGLAESGASLGHTDIPRLEDGRPEPIAGPFPAAWPPGPSGDWSGVEPELWPATTKPAVRGMVDGSASRVDRLRAGGNGVVPVVVATAFRALLRHAAGRGVTK